MAETTVNYWIEQITQYESTFKKWMSRVEKIEKRYRDEQSQVARPNATAKFNILWSNVQTIVPAVFSRLPKPDVSRRFKDNDPVGRVAAEILERALDFEIEHYPDYRGAMKNSVLDRFLGGRGTSWVRYEPHIVSIPKDQPEDGLEVTEDVDEAEEQLEHEYAPVDYVHWRDFGHTQGRTWEEVNAVWRKVYMRRPALVERFGEELGNQIPLDTKPEEQKRNGGYQAENSYEACIYEIWDKSANEALWLSKSMNKILDRRDDPLKLEGFFPCPRPLFATLTTDSLVPVPDFTLYQDQAHTLDLLANRINGLVDALRVRGGYDAAIPELARIFSEGDNTVLIPVKNWAAFAEKNGLAGAISLVDLKPIYEALNGCYEAMDQQKQQVYEITGIADIVRGQGEASETATAQRIKGQYASLRLKNMQSEVAQYAADIINLKAQVICQHFQSQTIMQMACVDQLNEADKEYIDPAIQLLKSSELSEFRIDISSDSLVEIDEDREKEQATEFVTAVSQFMGNASKIPPEAAPMMGELLKFAVARYKAGKSVEGVIDQFVEQMKQRLANPQPPQPDPAVQKAQLDAEAKAQEQQAEQAHEQQVMAAEQAHEREMAQREEARLQMQAMLDQQNQAAQQRFDAAMAEQERRFQAMQAQQDRMLQVLLQRMKDETTLETAELSAATTLQAAQESAAEGAANA